MSNIEKPTVKNQHGKRKDNFNGTLGKSDRVEIAAVSDKRKIIKKKCELLASAQKSPLV
jgi:hypothetical protein